MLKLEEINERAIKNLKVVRLFRREKFRKYILQFLRDYTEKAFLSGYYGKALDLIQAEASREYSEFKKDKISSEYISVGIILEKWLIEAHLEGGKEREGL